MKRGGPSHQDEREQIVRGHATVGHMDDEAGPVASVSNKLNASGLWRANGAALLPPLENGDRLPRREFERRYAAQPRIKKAELIAGVVHMTVPVGLVHAEPHALIQTVLLVYSSHTPGVTGADNATVRLDAHSEVQPDVLLRIDESAGGTARVSADGYLEGAPELVVEVAASSASIDLHDKLRIYERAGVREYIVWRTHDDRIDYFGLAEGRYLPLAGDAAGVVRSEVFPGLWVDTQALCQGDLATALSRLQEGKSSPIHRHFVERLMANEKRRLR